MAITLEFYKSIFPNDDVDESEFNALATIATDVCYNICILKPSEDDLASTEYQTAEAWQIRMLIEEGGIDAVLGRAESSAVGGSESLGDYSINTGSRDSVSENSVRYIDGIPVCNYSLMILRRMGLMDKWAYLKRE